MKGWIIGAIVLVLVLIGAVYFASNSDSDDVSTADNITNSGGVQEGQVASNVNNDNAQASGSENVKTFVISASHLRFYMNGVESPELKVKEGDTVRIEFNNEEGFHDWVLDEFGAATAQIQVGKSETIEFIANKKGTFEYYCSVGKHRQNGMKGVFIVE